MVRGKTAVNNGDCTRCRVWQAEFEQKQVDMREQVVKFEKFIQENDAKRIRAEAKAKQVGRVTKLPCSSLHNRCAGDTLHRKHDAYM